MESRFLLRFATKRSKLLPRQLRYASSKHPSQQANPIGDYYTSILSSPSSSTAPSTAPDSDTNSQPSYQTSTAAAPSAPITDASILFSSRLSSPLERRNEIKKNSVLVAGVWVPPRPAEPDNCCMSGCVNCVWDRYRDELEEWADAKKSAQASLQKESALKNARRKGRRKNKEGMESGGKMEEGEVAGTGLMLGATEEGAEHTMVSMDDDGGGSEGNWGTAWGGGEEELFKGVPVGIREFMRTEKRLKERHAREVSSAG